MRIFKNPSNGYIERATTGLSWLWALLFGPFYLLWRGYWGHALISCAAAILTFGLSNVFYAIAIYRIAPKYYLRQGWVEIEGAQAIVSPNNASVEAKKTVSSEPVGAGQVVVLGVAAICLVAFVFALVSSVGVQHTDVATQVGFEEAKAESIAKQPRTARAPIRLSAAQAYDRITSNELRFRREVEESGGVIVSARVGHIESGFLGGGPVLSLKTSQPFIDILATLEHSERRKAERVDKGSFVHLLCHRPTTVGGGFAYLHECKFLETDSSL